MGSLYEYFHQLAVQSLNAVDPISPAPIPSPCASGGAQDTNAEPAGSTYLCDWSMDTRSTHKLSDAEVIDKMHWQLRALHSRERLQREFERMVQTVYPASDQS